MLGWRSDEEAAALDVGPSALVSRPEYQQQLASCAVQSFAQHVLGRELSADEKTGWLVEKTSSFASGTGESSRPTGRGKTTSPTQQAAERA